jgi:cell wall-associated NlpC family hydrolase
VDDRGDEVVAAARRCVGARFRVQGRTRDGGLDCVGLVAIALHEAGVRVRAPGDYRLSGDNGGRFEPALSASGLEGHPPGAARRGDILLIAPSQGQRHLAVRTPDGFVHAHAGLGKIVETPGWPEQPVLSVWRPKRR